MLQCNNSSVQLVDRVLNNAIPAAEVIFAKLFVLLCMYVNLTIQVVHTISWSKTYLSRMASHFKSVSFHSRALFSGCESFMFLFPSNNASDVWQLLKHAFSMYNLDNVHNIEKICIPSI
jgi:hypothetical protein